MLTVFLIMLYGILFAIAVYNLVNFYKKKKVIDAGICFQVAFIIYYILIPILSLIIIELYPGNLTGMLFRISQSKGFVYAYIFTFIAYFTFIFGYKVKFLKNAEQNGYNNLLKAEKEEITKEASDNLNEEANMLKDKLYNEFNAKVYKIALFMGIFCLALALYSQTLIVGSLGNVLTLITLGDRLRAFGIDSSRYIDQSRLFAITLMAISLASPYFLFYALRMKNKLSTKVLLIVSMISCVIYFAVNAGRIAVLVFGLTFFIGFVFRKTKHPILYICIVSILSLSLLGTLDDLFYYLSYGIVRESSRGGLQFIVNEFAFPYLNLLNIMEINAIYGLRWGADFVSWIINIVPSSILSIFGLSKVASSYHTVTEYYRLTVGTSGGIPTDILSLGIRQFGLMGLLLISLLLSKICRFLDGIIAKVHSNNYYFITLRISSIMFLIIPYGDIDSFVRNRFDMILVFLFALVVSRKTQKVEREWSKIYAGNREKNTIFRLF